MRKSLFLWAMLTSAGSAQAAEVDPIRVCTQLLLPEQEVARAAQIAHAINPSNSATVDGVQTRIAALWQKKWQNGSEITVSFYDGSATVQSKVTSYALQWTNCANVRFKFVPADGQIRITFAPGGSSSYIGTDALSPYLAGKPTMQFGWLTELTSDDEYSRVVLHEFGHALGAIHEHQHPDSGIPWNKPKVYEYYQATQNWTPEEVDRNIFQVYDRSWLQYSVYDKTSIMHYAIPKELTDGVFEVGWNRVLSGLDCTTFRSIYPFVRVVPTAPRGLRINP